MLTGFLGAGKTTLLNRLLTDPDLADTVVIVNEFGEIGLDHLLVETVDDGLILLAAGCLCCTVRGDLIATLEDLLRRRDNERITEFRRVVVETTGLADPAPILHAILYHPYLSQRYAVAGVVTVVDALHGEDALDRHPEAVRQAAVADRIVVTKTDMALEPGALASLEHRLGSLNPAATLIRAVEANLSASQVIGNGLFTAEGKIADVRQWLRADPVEEAQHGHGDHGQSHHAHHHHAHEHHQHDVNRHDDRISAFALTSTRPVRRAALDMFLDLLRSTFGPRLLRLKGVIELVEQPGRPVVIHGVQHVLHVPAILPAWPDQDHRSRIVLIAEDLDRAVVERLWNACTGTPQVDAPDAAAMHDNPLAPATMSRRV